MKKLLKFVVFTLFSAQIFAGRIRKPEYVHEDARLYSEAQIFYEDGNYSDALSTLEKAKSQRKLQVSWEVETLENSLKPAEVKIVGDDIREVIKRLAEREDADAIEIFERYEKKYGFERFNYSSKKILEFIKTLSPYPECDYLEGLIYRLEGEYDISEKKLMDAFNNSSILDIPDEKTDILYSLADIDYTRKDMKKYEEVLLLIVSDDKAFKDQALKEAMKRTIESTKADCLEKFFLMYRTENYGLLRAYSLLSEFYLSKNEKNRALEAASLGCLTGFSKIYDVISKRNPDFEYTGLASFFNEVQNYPDIIEWGITNKVWKSFNDLAETAFKNQCSIFAIKLYSVLKQSSPEEYWRKNAELRLEVITGKRTETSF